MVTYKTKAEIALLREGGKILAEVLRQVAALAKPGVDTGQLEELAVKLIASAGGKPSFKGYSIAGEPPFPTALCTSLNNEVVHAPAIPARILKSGDVLKIDIGMRYPEGGETRGLFTDMAMTVAIGEVSPPAKKLIAATKHALELGIEQVKPGNSLNDIGVAIQTYIEKEGFSVVRDLVGHGVGYKVHEEPQVPHFRVGKRENMILKPGLTIAIEPMINIGGWQVEYAPDGFTIVTADGSLSAQFEHTVAVTEDGVLIITN